MGRFTVSPVDDWAQSLKSRAGATCDAGGPRAMDEQ